MSDEHQRIVDAIVARRRAENAVALWKSGGLDRSPDFRLIPTTAFDLETTGVGPSDLIVQVATGYIPPKGAIEPGINTLVNPGRPIAAEATAVHGIKDSDVALAPAFFEIAQGVSDELARGDVVVGYNAVHFDAPFLERELRAAGVTPRRLRIVDPMIWARWSWPLWPSHKLVDVCRELDIPFAGEAHDAMADIDATMQLFVGMVNYGQIPNEVETALAVQATIADYFAAEWAAFGYWFSCDGGGNIVHKTKKLRGNPLAHGSLRWALDIADLHPGARYVIEGFVKDKITCYKPAD